MRTERTRTNRIRRIELRSYHRRRTRHLLAGRTAHGDAWKRPPLWTEEDRDKRARKLNLARYHRRAQRRAKLGLNSRGQPYKTRIVQRAWDRLKAEFPTQPPIFDPQPCE